MPFPQYQVNLGYDPLLAGVASPGNGKIKIGVPGIDKDIVLEAADIDHFKSCLK